CLRQRVHGSAHSLRSLGCAGRARKCVITRHECKADHPACSVVRRLPGVERTSLPTNREEGHTHVLPPGNITTAGNAVEIPTTKAADNGRKGGEHEHFRPSSLEGEVLTHQRRCGQRLAGSSGAARARGHPCTR